jgi:hypothetical protein
MYMVGYIPNNDHNSLYLVETIGKWVEESRWGTKEGYLGDTKLDRTLLTKVDTRRKMIKQKTKQSIISLKTTNQ